MAAAGQGEVKGPLAAIAAGGAILSGLVGYYTTYRTVAGTQPAAEHTSRAAAEASSEATSIAVLPFVNMSGDKDQEYFADGLAEELLNQLAQVPQLKVIARTSSFSFKGKPLDIAAIAQTLHVGHVLEGSVRRSGSTLRVTAQMIRTQDSTHVWSQSDDRQLDDVFAVQDEISQAVVHALKIRLLPQQTIARPLGQTADPQAYAEYLRGRSDFQQHIEGHLSSRVAMQRAIAIDWRRSAKTTAALRQVSASPAQPRMYCHVVSQ